MELSEIAANNDAFESVSIRMVSDFSIGFITYEGEGL